MWWPPWAETFHKLLPPKVGGFGGQWRLAGARKWQRQVSDGFQQLASLPSDKSKVPLAELRYVNAKQPLIFGSKKLLGMFILITRKSATFCHVSPLALRA